MTEYCPTCLGFMHSDPNFDGWALNTSPQLGCNLRAGGAGPSYGQSKIAAILHTIQ